MKIDRIFFILVAVILSVSYVSGQTISPYVYGQNAWMPDTIGNHLSCPGGAGNPCILYGSLHNHWSKVKQSGVKAVRFGGINPDVNFPTNYQYIKMIDSIRFIGAEPIMQVPYNDGMYTATQAANLVTYINITKGKNIRYWAIGNEPNLKYSNNNTAQKIATYVKSFSSAMKLIDPTIQILAPDLAWYDQVLLYGTTNDGLLDAGGPNDITGIVPGRAYYYVDVITYHYYPYNGSQSRANVIADCYASGKLNANLIELNSNISTANTFHGRTGVNLLRSGITEFNVNYQNPGTNNSTGVGVHSFLNGQYWAEAMSVAMRNNVLFFLPWSVHESSGNRGLYDLGYLDDNTNFIPRPAYYHLKLLSDNFKSTFVTGTTNVSNVKAFGSMDASGYAVMILNQESATGYNFTLRFNSAAIAGSDPLKININGGLAAEFIEFIPARSTALYVFDPSGVPISRFVYSESDASASPVKPPSYQVYDPFSRMGGLLQTIPAPGWIIDNSIWNRQYVSLNRSSGELQINADVPSSNLTFSFTRIFARTNTISSNGTIDLATSTWLHLRLKTTNTVSMRVELQDNAGNRTTAAPFLMNPINNSGSYSTYSYDFGPNLGCGGVCNVNKAAIRQITFFINYNGVSPFKGSITMNGLDFFTNGSLPVVYKSIFGWYDHLNEKVILKWETSSEINNTFFQIERFQEGVWVVIGKVTGNYTTSLNSQYSFNDEQPGSGLSLYRIKQVDLDGRYSYSKTVSVDVTLSGEKLIQNFSNPCSDQTEIRFFVKSENLAQVYLFNSMGALVRVLYDAIPCNQETSILLELSDLKKGIYFYKLYSGGLLIDTKSMIVY